VGGTSDEELIAAVLNGETARFESLISKYQPKVFATARKYARLESEIEDIVQEVFLKAFTKLASFRGESPFEHWLMRLAVRTCYDYLRAHQRSREFALTQLSQEETGWIENQPEVLQGDPEAAEAARLLVHRILEQLSPAARLVIQLLELEEKSIKEISELTGWSVPVVKVRAFRARAEMKKLLNRLKPEKYL
jgi:RNA polymerase sigma-70 factor, ECF subfamily